MTSTGIDRRSFLRRSAVLAAGTAAAAPLQAMAMRQAGAAAPTATSSPYGELVSVNDRTTGLPLLKLPRGFEYVSFGWTGDPMTDGTPTPNSHDGMAAFRTSDGNVALVRNHERGNGSPFTAPAYDPTASGGTTTLTFDPDAGRLLTAFGSLSGTVRNCAGGPTPWGSWLTCEETTQTSANGMPHGYVFEVPSHGKGDPTPYTRMGRFSHEAAAVDPATRITYLTEDTGTSGFYRYVPEPGGRYGVEGTLEMLKIGAGPYDTVEDGTGTTHPQTSWVPIAEPDPNLAAGASGVYAQGAALGGARFVRGEGAWYDAGRIYFVSTSGGPARQGQIFEYTIATGVLRVVYASTSADLLNAPDNLCVSPRGGIVLCEDGTGREYLHGLTRDGSIFRFAENAVVIPPGGATGKSVPPGDYTGSEWCGATFDPKNGNWLFVNVQSPGITFAITGPWRRGPL